MNAQEHGDPRYETEFIRELEQWLRRYEEILEQIGEGIMVLDRQFIPTLANIAAKEMLGLREDILPPRLPSEDLLAIARQASDDGFAEQLLTLWFPHNQTLKVRAVRLAEGQGILLALQDVTEEQLAQRIRREFVSHASHELKSPVAGLQALASAIRQALDDDPQTAARFADRMVDESERLARLINDLLDLSKLEDTGRFSQGPVDVSEIAGVEAEQVVDIAAAKKLDFKQSIAPDLSVLGDREQLGLMIRNLLENAVRYTPEGGRIDLALSKSDSLVLVAVRDTGIGIPVEAQARVFERFYRVDQGRSRDRGGTGLGLAIVKHVAELHRGSVQLDSELGNGSTFTVTLPWAGDAPEQNGT